MAKTTNSKKKDKGGSKIPDLTALLNQLNSSTEGVSQLMGSLDQVVAVASQFNIRKRLSLRTAKSAINRYIEMMGDIVRSIADTKFGNGDKQLKDILGYQETMCETIEENKKSIEEGQEINSKRDKISTDGRYPIIDFMGAFSQMIAGLVDPLQKIMNPSIANSFGFFRRRSRLMLIGFSRAMDTLLTGLINTVAGFDQSQLNSAMSVLVGDPETVSKNISKIDKSTTNSDKSSSNDIQENVKEVTTGRKMGILEMVTNFLSVFNNIRDTISLGIVNGWLMEKKINKFTDLFGKLITGLVNIFPKNSFDKNAEATEKRYETVGKLFNSIADIISTIVELKLPSVNKIKNSSKRISSFQSLISGSLSSLIDQISIFANTSASSITDEKTSQTLEDVIGIITQLQGITLAFYQIKPIRIRLATRSINLVTNKLLPALQELVIAMNKNAESENKINPDAVNSINSLLNNIKEIIITTMVIGLMAIPFILSIPLLMLEMLAIKGIVSFANLIFQKIGAMAPLLTASMAVTVAVIGAIAMVMVLVTASMLLIAMMIKPIFNRALLIMGGIGVILLVLLAMSIVFAVMGALILPAIFGAAAALVVVSSMLIIVTEMIILMGLLILVELMSRYIDQEAIEASLDAILNTADMVISKVLSYDYGKRGNAGANTGIIGGVAKMFLGGQAATILDLAGKVMILFLTIVTVSILILMVGVLLVLHKAVKKYKNLFVKKEQKEGEKAAETDTVVDDVLLVMNTANSIIGIILGSKGDVPAGDNRHQGLLTTIVSWVSPDVANMIGLAMKAAVVILTIVVVGLVFLLTVELKMLHDYMNGMNLQDIETKVQNLMTTISNVVNTILQSKFSLGEEKKDEGGMFSKIARAVLPDSLISIADGITKLGQFAMAFMVLGAAAALAKTADTTVTVLNKYATAPTNLAQKLQNLVSGVTSAMAGLSISEDDQDNVASFAKNTEAVNNFGRIQVSMDKMVNKINGLNIDKMKTLAEMWGNAAAFAKTIDGNFDKLADVLQEKIAPLIQDLKTAIQDADKHVTERAKNTFMAPPVAAPALNIEDFSSDMYNAIVKALETRNLGS